MYIFFSLSAIFSRFFDVFNLIFFARGARRGISMFCNIVLRQCPEKFDEHESVKASYGSATGGYNFAVSLTVSRFNMSLFSIHHLISIFNHAGHRFISPAWLRAGAGWLNHPFSRRDCLFCLLSPFGLRGSPHPGFRSGPDPQQSPSEYLGLTTTASFTFNN